MVVAGVLLASTNASAQTAQHGHHHRGHHHADAPSAPVGAPATSGGSEPSCTTGDARDLARRGWLMQAGGHWLDAETCLTAARAAGGHWVRDHAEELTSSLGIVSQHIGRFRVTGGVAGAVVSLNGTQVGTLPMSEPVRELVGQVRMTVTAEGHFPVSRDITILPGSEATVEDIAADAMREVPPPAPPVVVVAPVVPVVEPLPPVVIVPRPRMEPVAPSGTNWRTWGWATGIAGAGLLVMGVHGSYDALSEGTSYQTNCVGAIPMGRAQGCTNASSQAHTGEALEGVGYAVGGALIVTSIVLFTRGAPRETSAERGGVALRCGGGPGTVGIACGGSFQ